MNPRMICHRISECRGEFSKVPWNKLPRYGPFRESQGKRNSRWRTEVQVAYDKIYLYVRFSCQDEDILAQMDKHDDPLYDEEVVEVFIATESTANYYEFNLSPRNVIFDAVIRHYGSHFTGDPSWDCAGLTSQTKRTASGEDGSLGESAGFGNWEGFLAIPFSGIDQLCPRPGDRYAVNFYRIKRLDEPEFSCWSPTRVVPANFHVPECFGELLFTEGIKDED